ncbi:hypothetical protein B0H34DRAFT_767419 [Crassisporium funariophilum]|nr:hypothetical protein B0H34DRAFT_767419 [Crassisporium funariophilum]
MPPKATAFLSSTLATVSNHLKPHRAEAIQRIRSNTLCLVTFLILSYLLPFPSLFTAIRTFFVASNYKPWTTEWFYEWICVIEMGVVSVFSYNILEAAFAIKYPRAPLPQVTSPMKPHAVGTFSPTPKRPFQVLSPNSSPQTQKAFAFSPSSSLTSASMSFSSSLSNNTTYAQSPISTPSRVLHYSVPLSSSTNTAASSTSTAEYLATPSPVISAYRGKHSSTEVGRAFDGSYLTRIIPDDSSFEE